MSRTQITGVQVADGSITGIDIADGGIWREDLNTTSTGKAVITKVIAGTDIAISYTGVDPGTGDVTINFNSSTGGITASQHRNLDQLVHGIAESYYYDIVKSSGKVTSETWWTDSSKTKRIRDISYSYSGSHIIQSITKQYDSSGNTIIGETLTEDYTYSGGIITSITATLS